MSLRDFIKQVEASKQLNELAPAPSTTSTAAAPSASQKVMVKPGKPQQSAPPASITDQTGKVIAQGDAEQLKKLGDLVNTGEVTMMNPQTGKPLEEETIEEVAPPGMEDTVLALKKKFPGQEGKAYAIAWSQYNKTHGKNKDVKESKESMHTQKQTISESTLEYVLETHPHEHKMCQEGWGMDESLYEALCDYYFKEGRIPRKLAIEGGSALRAHVEECYAKDTGMIVEEDDIDEGLGGAVAGGVAGAALGGPVGAVRGAMAGDAIQDELAEEEFEEGTHSLGAKDLNPDLFPGDKPSPLKKVTNFATDVARGIGKLGSKALDAVAPDDDKLLANLARDSKKVDEESKLERMLRQTTKEETMFESKGKTEKTEKGLKHTGTYGREYDTDEEGNEKKIVKDEPKKGRGRPKKDGGETGKGFDFTALSKASGSKKPKKEVGKVSAKHKLTDKSRDEKADAEFEKDEAKKSDKKSKKVDETISKWDAQLRTLLEGKQVNEGLSVSTSVGQENMPDSVSITANDEDAHQLLKLINAAGLGSGVPAHAVKTNPVEELLKAHGSTEHGGSFSMPGTEEPGDVEVVGFDDAQSELDDGHGDDGTETLERIKKMLGIGKDAAPEPKHPDIEAGSDGEEHDDEESDEEDKEKIVGEEEVEEGGNKFTGNLAKAREEGKSEADLDGDGDMEKVKPANEGEEKVEEGQQTCNECGAMYEGDGHECSHEKMEEGQLNEWANSPQGQSEDEAFKADMDFMLKVLAGGINKPKVDQTVMPSTKVKVTESVEVDLAAEMRKLAGIR